MGRWEDCTEVRLILFLSAFKDITFSGAVDLLESANVAIEVLVRNNEWSSTFREVAGKFLHFADDFSVVVSTCFLVENFLVDFNTSFQFLALVPAAFDAPNIGPACR